MATADRPEQPNAPSPKQLIGTLLESKAPALCGAKRADPSKSRKHPRRTTGENTCRLPAGHGTDHPGYGNCRFHGGATPSHEQHSAKLEAQAVAVSVAQERDLDPFDALLWCVRLAAGELAFFSAKAGELDQDKLVVDHMRVRRHEGDASSFVERTSHSDLHIWVRARQDAMDRLARFTKMAIDAGVAERHVRVAERYGQLIGTLLERVLSDLRLTAEQQERAPEVVRRHLTLLEGGATEAAA